MFFFLRKLRRFIPSRETAQDDEFTFLIVNNELRNNQYIDVQLNSMAFSM